MARNPQTTRAVVSLHKAHLARREVQSQLAAERWRSARRLALLGLLAGCALQYYLLDVYLTIARLPSGIGWLP